jgi:hypothetical protein
MMLPVTGVDHVLMLVNSLDDASMTMRRLGFTVSPRGIHSAHLGSANHTIMFRDDYIELWAAITPTAFNALHRENLERGEGIYTAALTALDADLIGPALRERGMATDVPVHFSRPVVTPEGTRDAEFTVVRPNRDQLPNGFMFFCQHHTPELVWVPEWMRHANTARGIRALIIEADAPERAADIYGRLLPSPSPEPIPGGLRVHSGKAYLDFRVRSSLEATYGPAELSAVRSRSFKVVQIGVGALETARNVLEENGVRFFESAASLLIPPHEAHGVLFEFVAET